MQQKDERGDFETGDAKGNIRTNTQSRRGGWGKPSYTGHNHKLNNGYKADMKCNFESNSTSKYKDTIIFRDFGINVGDIVVLLPVNNGQKFVVLNKVTYCGDFDENTFEGVEDW